jgi:hypothetical protein
MAEPGDSLKQIFESVYLKEFGSNVVVYQNWNSPSMVSFESHARKVQEHGKTVFEFKLGTDVYTDNVIQIVGSRDFWRVEDVEDEDKYGTLIKHVARVTKINQQGNPIQLNSEGKAVHYTTNIQGHNYGGIQQGTHNSTQNISLTNNQPIGEMLPSVCLLDLSKRSPRQPVCWIIKLSFLGARRFCGCACRACA